MTPLAQIFVKECLAQGKNLPEMMRGYCDALINAHHFECSSIMPLSQMATTKMLRAPPENPNRFEMASRLAFLPDQLTWLEWRVSPSLMFGALLSSVSEKEASLSCFVCEATENVILHPQKLPLDGHNEFGKIFVGKEVIEEGDPEWIHLCLTLGLTVYSLLSIINSPKTFGRKQHQPHAGLQKAIAKSRGMVGKFPLKAWTEIKLDVAPPKYAGDKVNTSHLSGGKAFHFCRKHLRFKGGQWEHVREHWRGDPSLGIKQQRYTMTNKGAVH